MRILQAVRPRRWSWVSPKASRGFTLVEMMLVIAVVGVIVALVISRYTHAASVGGAGGAAMEAAAIASAVDNYKSDHGTLPPTVPANSYIQVTPTVFGGANNPYLNATPTDAGSVYYIGVGSGTLGFGSATDFWVADNRTYDGSALANMKKSDGTTPVAGTQYHVIYHSSYGMIAY